MGLGIDPLQLGAQIINFAILVFVLKRFLFTPILSMLDKRRAEIQEGLKLKEEMGKQSEVMKEEGKKLRTELRAEERRIVKEAVEEAKKREHDMLEAAKKEIREERDKMLAEVAREREKLFEEARQRSLQYAVLISEKLLGETLDKKNQERLLKEALSDLDTK